jgi:CRISPR-associated endoribonuclease Cas6
MRISLKLKSNKTVKQSKEINSKYYSAMHGWIYNKLENTDFSDIYSKKEFKPFCFSNLYPIKNTKIEENQIYNLTISSPNEMIMIALLSNINVGEMINLGEYSFELIDYKPLGKKEINSGDELDSETIINITLNESGKRKAITLSKDSNSFKKNLSKNLIRKYNQYNEEKIEEDFNLWENIEIEEIKNTESAVKINLIKNSDNWFNVIGARYKFKIGNINETQKKILQLCYDLGFAERNSFGFGFMNIKSSKKEGEGKEKKDKINEHGVEDD